MVQMPDTADIIRELIEDMIEADDD